MIDFLTYEDYYIYDPHIKPSQQRKTYRVRDAFEEFFPSSKTVHKLEDITEKIVLIEVFKRLEGQVERVYIGSARLWGYVDLLL